MVVPDLDRAHDSYRRLGFRLTPRSSHEGPLAPGGLVEPWGSGNHCAMFHDGYFEVLGVTDPTRHHEHVAKRLEAHAGLSLIALGCADVAAAVAGLRRRGVDVRDDRAEIERPVPFEGATRRGRFRFAFLAESAFPEGEIFYIQHLTPEVLWQPALLDQPNGVTGLAGTTICSGDVAATCRRLGAILGQAPSSHDGAARFALNRGWIEVATPEALAARFPGVAPPPVPSIAGVTFAAADLSAARAHLDANGITAQARGDRSRDTPTLWVAPEAAEGAIVEFQTG